MKAHSIILIICQIITTGCLVAGYILAGYWLILPVLLTLLIFWIFAGNRSAFWPASSLLLAYVLLAAFGITAGLSSILMTVACTASLVSWDLMLFNQSIGTNSLSKPNASLEKYHINSLALAAFASLILAFISSYINLNLPFVVIILLVLMTIGCLLYSTQYILKNKL